MRPALGANRTKFSASVQKRRAPPRHDATRDAAIRPPSMNLGRRLRSGAAALYAAIALSLAPNRPPIGSHTPPAHAPVAMADNSSISGTMFTDSLPRAAAVALSSRSINELGTPPVAVPDDLLDPPRASFVDEGEFALSVRLVTAVVLGALMGGEPGAATLSLGVRALTVVSIVSALVTVYTLLPPGAETTALVRVMPPAAVPLVAAAVAVVALGAFVLLAPPAPIARRRRSSRTRAMTASVVAAAAAAGAACAAGQALPAGACYLTALALCRSASHPSRRRMVRAQARRPLVSLRVDVDGGTRVVQGDTVDEVVRDLRQMTTPSDKPPSKR